MTPNDPRHGSSSGYYAHKRVGQVPCDPCRLAVSEYQRRYKLGYRRIDGRDFTEQIEADDALTGGRWVLDKRARVMRWHPDTVTA